MVKKWFVMVNGRCWECLAVKAHTAVSRVLKMSEKERPHVKKFHIRVGLALEEVR